MQKEIIPIFGVAIFFMVTFTSCSKKEVVAPAQKAVSTNISDLKTYFFSVSKIDTAEIRYDVKSQMFSVSGVDQISMKDLTVLFENSKKSKND